ncbi:MULTISPECIES: glycoside hydrolase family 13 protein [unclassified Streptomyces]|uniref:glycoside hydrolase family 13 protein n=1 Tax=unclassified Streptomyces TaxID=2593676 RepID=UPI0021C96699|nr:MULTISPECIES: glycoside hydrolase family 13 protein [unclassified Streptomyces]WSQ79693.1 glycoside hydrolase family 13 protein [Streptomyces sp. NBC_01213]WSR06911.1 glycoside hydrolase family 13 protein [Streptomyces sp. NBC_01208]
MTTHWWRHAAIYQIYVRSFADGDGDGTGDLAGVRSRLPYLRELGVDALWFNPWYTSPMADGGYDVADYRDVDPLFGTLAEAEELITRAHEHGLRVLIDLVPNHCSDQHVWFREALAAGPGSPERERFWFVPGKGEAGELPPNDWTSYFGGSAWTRVTEADGSAGPWYLHMFAPEQPDLNWEHPEVRAEFEDVLRFWLDRGVDGFRIDVAHGLAKKPGLPDVGPDPDITDLPYQDCDAVHDIYRSWRKILDSYDGERTFVGEVWLPTPEQSARYLRPDELHSAFNFDFLCCAWEADALRRVIEETLAGHAPVGAPPTWVLSNHDTIRHVTRYGREDTSFDMGDKRLLDPSDPVLGRRRARAAALLTLSLPGGVYVYQGDELGLPEVQDLPDHLIQDPTYVRSGRTDRGRDGCRVPLPWSGSGPSLGFSPEASEASGATPWLPQPAAWSELSVASQQTDPESFLSLYRSALALRRDRLAGMAESLTWVDAQPGTVCFDREDGFRCLLNASATAVPLPEGARVLLASGPLPDGAVPPDTAVWLSL